MDFFGKKIVAITNKINFFMVSQKKESKSRAESKKSEDFLYNKVMDLDVVEVLYSLNFEGRFLDILEFTQASWNLTNTTLNLREGVKNLSYKQKVAFLILGKSKRLLRAIYKLIIIGYWPEASIIFRTLFEAQLLLIYTLEDKTNKRAHKWLTSKNPQERWPVKEQMKNYKNLFEGLYEEASLYTHNHVLSTPYYVQTSEKENILIEGPIGGGETNFKNAARILGDAAMMNASICEIASGFFSKTNEWNSAHKKIISMTFYKKQQKGVKKRLPKIKKDVERMFNNITPI